MHTTSSLIIFNVHTKGHLRTTNLPRSHKDHIIPLKPILTLKTLTYNVYRLSHPHFATSGSPLIIPDSVTESYQFSHLNPNAATHLSKSFLGDLTTIQLLSTLATSFASHNSFTFYTDGSVD